MGQIRHIAYRAEDPEAMVEFFTKGLGLKLVQRRPNGAVDLTDGIVGVTILAAGNNAGGRSGSGLDHIGFTVTDEDETRKTIEAAGATEANTLNLGAAYYEVKYQGPEGIVIDIGHWAGTAPVEETESAPTHA